MHQTFYIDADEEISSVIDRLNKSMSKDNYFVLPKRALFLQSIVNLKLLKREADKTAKRVIIVTQDEIGASMAERSNLEVRDNLDGLGSISDVYVAHEQAEEEEDDAAPVEIKMSKPREHDKQARLSSIGTKEFYVQDSGHSREVRKVGKKNQPMKVADKPKVNHADQRRLAPHANQPVQVKSKAGAFSHGLDPQKAKTLEKLYAPHHNFELPAENEHVGSKVFKKIFISFTALAFVLLLGVAAYLLVPSAKIVVTPNIQIKKADLTIQGDSDVVSAENSEIPLKVINLDKTVTLSYQVNNQKSAAGQKAKGKVTIYNEYNSDPQPLVETTRLETSDGKIFHLVKGVTVPGTSGSNDQLKPGVITADIIADQPGGDYNIEPTTLTIPGFAGGPKFDKFYAKLTDATTGGNSEGESMVGGKITQQDMDSAKQKTEAAFKQQIASDAAAGLADGEIAMPEAQQITIVKSSASSKIGSAVQSFDYTVTGSVKALVFSEADVKKDLAKQEKSDLGEGSTQISKIEYGPVDCDFDNAKFALKVHSETTITPKIDQEKLKAELLGKTDSQLSAILNKYASIKAANVEFMPTFISRIPDYGQRVSIEIKE